MKDKYTYNEYKKYSYIKDIGEYFDLGEYGKYFTKTDNDNESKIEENVTQKFREERFAKLLDK